MASELVEKYRKSLQAHGKPNANFSDLQLTLEVHRMLIQGNKDIDDYGEDFADDVRDYMKLPKPGREGFGGALKEFPAAAHGSYEQKKGSYKSFGALTAGAVGADETADELMLSSRRNMEKAGQVGASIRDIEYVDDLGSLGRWFIGATGEVVVDAAEIFASMGIGKLVGGAAASRATSAGSAAKRGLDTADKLQRAATKAKDAGFLWGTGLSAVGTSTAQNTGQVYADLYPYTKLPEFIEDENGVKTPNPNYLDPTEARAMSFGAGLASGMLDSAVPMMLVKGLTRKGIAKSQANSLVGRMLSKMPANLTWMPKLVAAGGGEALTESAQEVIQMLTVKSHTGEEWGAQDWNRAKNAGALGFVGGTVLGGGMQGVQTLAGSRVDDGSSPGSSPDSPTPTPGDPEGGFTARDMERVNAMEVGSFVQRALSPKSGIVTKNFGDGMIEVQYPPTSNNPDGELSVENGSVFIQREDLTAKKFTDHEIENMDSHAIENLLQTDKMSKPIATKMEAVLKKRKTKADPEAGEEAKVESEYVTVDPDGLSVEFKDGNVVVSSNVGGKKIIYATAELSDTDQTYILKDDKGEENKINFPEGLSKDLQKKVHSRLHEELASKAVKDMKMVMRAEADGNLHKVWPGLDKISTMSEGDLYRYSETVQQLVDGGQNDSLRPVLVDIQAEMRVRGFYVDDEKGGEFVPGNPDGDGTPMHVATVYTQLVNELKTKDAFMSAGQLGNHIIEKSREFAKEFDVEPGRKISNDSANKIAAQAREELARIDVYDGNKVTRPTAFDLDTEKAESEAINQATIEKRIRKVAPLKDKQGHYVKWGVVSYRIKGISDDDGMVTLEPLFDGGETITVDYNEKKGAVTTKKTIPDGEFTYEFDGKKERKYKDIKVTRDDTEESIKPLSAFNSKLRMVFDEAGENFRLFDADDYQRSGLTGLFPNTDQGILDAKKRWADDVGEKDTSGISKYWSQRKNIKLEGTRRVRKFAVTKTGWTQVVEYDVAATEEAFKENPDAEPVISGKTYESFGNIKIFEGKKNKEDTKIIPAFSEHAGGTIYVSGYKVIEDDKPFADLPEHQFQLEDKDKGKIAHEGRLVTIDGIRTDDISSKFAKAAGLIQEKTTSSRGRPGMTPPAIKERELAPEGIEGYTIEAARQALSRSQGTLDWLPPQDEDGELTDFPQTIELLKEELGYGTADDRKSYRRAGEIKKSDPATGTHRHIVLKDEKGRVFIRPTTTIRTRPAIAGMQGGALSGSGNKSIDEFLPATSDRGIAVKVAGQDFEVLGFLNTETTNSAKEFHNAAKTKIIADYENADDFSQTLSDLTAKGTYGSNIQKFHELKQAGYPKPKDVDPDAAGRYYNLGRQDGTFDPKLSEYMTGELRGENALIDKIEEQAKSVDESNEKSGESTNVLEAIKSGLRILRLDGIRMTTLTEVGLQVYKKTNSTSKTVTGLNPSHWLTEENGFGAYSELRTHWMEYQKEYSREIETLGKATEERPVGAVEKSFGEYLYGESKDGTIHPNDILQALENEDVKNEAAKRFSDATAFVEELLDIGLETDEDGKIKPDDGQIRKLYDEYSTEVYPSIAAILKKLQGLRKGNWKNTPDKLLPKEAFANLLKNLTEQQSDETDKALNDDIDNKTFQDETLTMVLIDIEGFTEEDIVTVDRIKGAITEGKPIDETFIDAVRALGINKPDVIEGLIHRVDPVALLGYRAAIATSKDQAYVDDVGKAQGAYRQAQESAGVRKVTQVGGEIEESFGSNDANANLPAEDPNEINTDDGGDRASQLSIPSIDNPGVILTEEALRKYTDGVLRNKFGKILGHVSEIIADPQLRQQNVQENTEAVAEFMKGAKLDGKPISGDLTLQRVQELADESTKIGKMAMNFTRMVSGHPLLKRTKVFWNTWENYRNNTSFESGRYKLAVTYGNKIVMGDTYKLQPDSSYTAKEHLLFTIGEELAHSVTSSTLEAATYVGKHNELPPGWPQKTLSKDELRKLHRDSERMLDYLSQESKRGGTLYRPQLDNIHEMWAGFVSNPGFREWVGGLDALPSTLKNDIRSPFRQVYDWFVRILNRILSRNPDTRVLNVLDDQFKKLVEMSKEVHSYEAPVAGLFSQLSFDFDAKPNNPQEVRLEDGSLWVPKTPGEQSVEFDYSKYVGSPTDPDYARRVADYLIVEGSRDLDGDIAYQWHEEYGLTQQVLIREMDKAHRRRMAEKIRRGHASEEELVPYMTKESADLGQYSGLTDLLRDSKPTHEVDPVMFSKALEVAKNLPQEKGTHEQFISMMKKSGVKEEELRDLKLINHDGSLVSSINATTKQALIAHIESHTPQFSERLMEDREQEPPPPVIKALQDARDASRVAQHDQYWWMDPERKRATVDRRTNSEVLYDAQFARDDFHRAWLANDLDGLVGEETADALREQFGKIDLGIKWVFSVFGQARGSTDHLADNGTPDDNGFHYGTKEKPIELRQILVDSVHPSLKNPRWRSGELHPDDAKQNKELWDVHHENKPPILGFRLEKSYASLPFSGGGPIGAEAGPRVHLAGTDKKLAKAGILTREYGMQTTSAHMALSQLATLYARIHNYTAPALSDDTVPYSRFNVKGGKNYRILKISLPDSSEIKASGVSQHFEEDNLGWIRFTERETPSGKSVLFVEEIQSDPAQKIDKAKARQKERDASKGDWFDPDEANYSTDMPFKKSWPEVMLKRMTRWAVDNGFDSIAWVSADIQRERNRLESKEEGGFFEAIYDRTLRNSKLWKRLGVKPERGSVSDAAPPANATRRKYEETDEDFSARKEGLKKFQTGGKVFSAEESERARVGHVGPIEMNLKDVYIVDLSGITHLPSQPSYASSEELSAPRDPELEKASVATSIVEAAGASLNEAEAVMASVLSNYTEEELDSEEMKAILAQLQRIPEKGDHVKPEVVKNMLEKSAATLAEGREAIMSIADTGKMVNDFGNPNIRHHAQILSLNLAEGYRKRMQELSDEDDQTVQKVEKRVREHKDKLKAVVDRLKGADQARAKKELTEEFIRVLEESDTAKLIHDMGLRTPLNLKAIASKVDADKLYDVLDGIADADYEIEALTGEQAFQQLAGIKSEQVGVAKGNDVAIQAALASMLGNEGRNKITQTHFTMALRISKNRLAGSLEQDYKLLNRMASDEDYDRIPTDGAFGTALKNIKKQRDQLKEATSGLTQNRLRSKLAKDMAKAFTERVDDFRSDLGELPPVVLVEGKTYKYVRFKRDKNGDLTEEIEELTFDYKLPHDTSSPESKAQMNIAKEMLDVVNSDVFRAKYQGTPISVHLKSMADELAKVPFAHQFQLAHYGMKLGFLQSFSQTFGRAGPHGASLATAINGVTTDHAANHTRFSTQGLLVSSKISALHKLLDPTAELPLFIDEFYNTAIGWLNDHPDIPDGQLTEGARKAWADLKKREVYGYDYTEKAFEAFKALLLATDQQGANFMSLNKEYGHSIKDDSMDILSFVTGDIEKLYRREVGQGAITLPRAIDKELIYAARAALATKLAPDGESKHDGDKIAEIENKIKEVLGKEEPGSKGAIAELLGKIVKDDLHDTFLDPFISQVGAHSQFYHIKIEGKKEFLFPERMAAVWRSLAHEKPGARLHKFIDEIAGGDLTDEAYADAATSFVGQLKIRSGAVIIGYNQMFQSEADRAGDPLRILQSREMDQSLNGRALANYLPSSYFRYQTHDTQNSLQRVGKIIQAYHFGRDGDKLTKDYNAMQEELGAYQVKYNDIARKVGIKTLGSSATPPLMFKPRIYRLIEAKTGITKQEFTKIRDGAALRAETERAWAGLHAFLRDSESWNMDNKGTMEALGTISFLAVNNPKSSFMGSMSIPDLVKRLGLNATGLRAVGETLIGLPKEIAGTFLERFGLDLLSATQYEEMIQPFYVDLEQSIAPAERRSDIGKRGELTQAGFRRNLRKLKHHLTQAGGHKNRAKLKGGKFVAGSLRTALTNPFSYTAQVVNKRITMAFIKLLHRRVLNAADVLDDMGIDPHDNSTELSAEDLGFKDTKMDRMIFGNKAMIEWLNNRLAQEGSSLTRLAQDFRRRRREDANALPIDIYGARRAWSIAMSEVTYDATHGKSMLTAHGKGKFFGFLLNWSLASLSQANQMVRNPEGKVAMRESLRYAIVSTAWLMPIGVAITLWTDWWDEEILGKPSNLRKVPPILGVPVIGLPLAYADPRWNTMAFIERTGRASNVAGAGQEIISQVLGGFDPSHRKADFSRRVLFIGALTNGFASAKNYITSMDLRRGETFIPDYSQVVRPLMYSVGLNGLLQHAQAVTHLVPATAELPFLSAERRVADIIGMRNILRAHAKVLGMELTVSRGGNFLPSALTVAIRKMERAAYANDTEDFLKAYRLAVSLSDAENPHKHVIEKFKPRTIANGITRYTMSNQDLNVLLSTLDVEEKKRILDAQRAHRYYLTLIGGKPRRSRTTGVQYSEELRRLALD